MIKVLLVDDEYYFRQALKKMVDWEALGFEIVGEASNGKDALALVPQADLALVDVNMPRMDGLAFLKEVNETGCKIKVIMVTVYSEFDYAKQALQYGALDYILKPVEEAELRRLLVRARGVIEKESEISTSLELLKLENKNKFYIDITDKQGSELLESLMYGTNDGPITLSSMKRLDFLMMLRAGNRSALDKFIGDLFQGQRYTPEQLYILLIEIVSLCIEFCNEKGAPFDRSGICTDAHNVIIHAKKVCEIKNWVKDVVFDTLDRCASNAKDNSKITRMIDEIKRYIGEHYGDATLKVSSIAQEFFINYQYLCKLFRQQTGATINEFITRLRMNKAKEFIDSGYYSLQGVAQKVGYDDANYFSKCFKKAFGVSPSRYINSKEDSHE